MQNYERFVVVIAICCFLVVTSIPINASKSDLPQGNVVNDAGQKSSGNPSMVSAKVESHMLPDSIVMRVLFPPPIVAEVSGRHTVEMGDLLVSGDIGEPVLPFKTLKILIPNGMEPQSIEAVHNGKKLLIGEFLLEYGRSATPISLSHDLTIEDQPNAGIYGSTAPFPGTLFTEVSEQNMRGYEILLMNLHPVQYVPKTGELYYFDTMTLTVTLQETGKTSPLLRNLQEDQKLVRSFVDNPEAVETYTTAAIELATQNRPASVDPSKSYDYVVITTSALNASFQPLIDWKKLKGLNATTVLVENITNNPDYFSNGMFGDGNGTLMFNSTAARVRNFVKDIYLNWETEYVLLGGDTSIVPHRGVYGIVNAGGEGEEVDYNIPCDMYFGALDGSWDNDNDTVWGEGIFPAGPETATEGDEADFYAEVYIGRATVTTPEQIDNFVDKTLWYEQNTDDEYFKKTVMVGETLDPETKSGNIKDVCADEIPQYTHRRLYSRDGTYSKSNVLSAINNGIHILNHAGHTNMEIMMDISRSEVDTLITNSEYFLGYSTGCYAGAIDADCVVEHYIYSPHGAFAFISNSRYGWYHRGMMTGAGDVFDIEFFEVLNDTVTNLGKALQTSKENLAGFLSQGMRWTYFELNLIGDPETPVTTEIVAPTAQFDTDPQMRLEPPTLKGYVNLTGMAKKGTAAGATFSNYTIDYGVGNNPATWMTTGIELVNSGQDPIVNDTLASWDTNLVTPATYTLRLTVKDADGRVGEDRWVVKVQELPAIRVEPQTSYTQAGLNVTVSVTLTDPENLWGLEFKFLWNTTLLDYVDHEVYIPRDTYYWGVLRNPVTISKNKVNETTGIYWIAAKSTAPEPFERDGTVFNMTFQALASGTCSLTIVNSSLTDQFNQPMINKVVNGSVEIAPGVHDMAVTNVSSTTVVGQGYNCRIMVTVANEGTFGESFNFTVYANGTQVNTTQLTLPASQSTTVVVLWDTTGWTKANYTISVEIPALPDEDDLVDNSLSAGIDVCVTIAGDVDADSDVDIYDIVMMSGAYGKKEGQPGYLVNCDIDGDGDIDIYDIVIAAGNYGK